MLAYAVSSEIEIHDSRVGPVRDLGPIYFEITNNDKLRMPVLRRRDFNPFFALAEFSWFYEGSNSLAPLEYFLSHYKDFSDDGVTLNGAYGYRLRRLSVDQIKVAIRELQKNPNSRRVVLNMWTTEDLGSDSKDIPCNTSIMLKIRQGQLDMTVINRSNDLFLGVPYNVLMFYLLQVYLSKELKCMVGFQRHFTDSLHLYQRDLKKAKDILDCNNIKEMESLSSKVNLFDISQYLEVNHQSVLNLEFESINVPIFRDLFLSYNQFRESRDFKSSLNLIPDNLLGYIAYLWYSNKKDFNEQYNMHFKHC
ncbi:thymidylate synthase [Brevibacillus sp. HD1.4A]|uniref:thymidylate synthase n=1 Tax=Brevibacillus sp. HD1.4A TaxID=2738978 RepID=UPI00156BAA55|nr:thymidylate synthase [Brevibacillus sp. HD1.4A]NRQ56337.1 thymidylate synthase [Brevibacillus sp. HD1.4A]